MKILYLVLIPANEHRSGIKKIAPDKEKAKNYFAAAEGNMFSTAIYSSPACRTLPLNSITNKVAFLTLGHNVVIISEKALGEQQIPF